LLAATLLSSLSIAPNKLYDTQINENSLSVAST
jgi:hypothetical protein